MRVLVCGGRDFRDRDWLYAVLTKIHTAQGIDTIIHGGARGADTLAGMFAKDFGFNIQIYPADWKRHGRSAGPIRNNTMLIEGKPNLVVAFPGGHGTANMIKQAQVVGVRTMVV
jgi:hypothetical protein